jgi:hypothetical protein
MKVKVAERVPVAVGVNWTVTAHAAPARTVGGHVFAVMAKSDGSDPEIATLSDVKFPFPMLVNFT